MHTRVILVLLCWAQVAACQTGHGSLTGDGNEKRHTHDHVLLSITVTPLVATVNVGSSSGFVATANFSDNTTQDVTTSATWLSLSTGVATVGASADPWPMTCAGAGAASIVATYNGFSNYGTLNCTPQAPPSLSSISVTPGNPTVYNGQSIGFTATGTYSDGSHQNITSSVNWTSGTLSVGTVGPLTATESGNCLATGATTITATDPATGINGFTTLNCTPVPVTLLSIAVTPVNTTVYIGTAQNFTATGTYSDGSTHNLTASATWSSSNDAVATVGPVTTTEPGNCIAVGSVTITATLGAISGNTGLTCATQVITPTLVSITLNPLNPSQYNGSSDTFTATCKYSDNSTRVCTTADPLTSTVTVWASATPSVASLGALTTVQTVNCLTTGTSVISATIGAVSGNTTQSCGPPPVTLVSIAVTPTDPTQYNGSSVSFTATGTYSDSSQKNLTSSASWTSGTLSVATISANVATCVANSGSSVITATFGAISGNTTLTCAAVPPAPTGENAGCAIGDVASAPFNTTEITTVLGVTVTVNYPHTCLYTATNGTPAPGSLVSKSCPASQAAFQSDLNGLTTGQTLQYPNGCTITITSPVSFPAVSGADITHWNWFESTGGAGFPAEHTRSSPCILGLATMAYYPQYTCGSPADLTVHIVCAANGDCLNYASGAHYWRNIGIDVHLGSTATNNGNGLVDFSGADHIIWDRYLMHGNALNCTRTGKAYACTSTDLKNGFSFDNATNIGVINGWGYDILCPQGNCTDAHVLGGGNGTQPAHTFKIYGNLLAAAGEDWIMGGAGGIGITVATPTDWDIRNNHWFRPVSWVFRGDGSGQHPEIKNHFEIKNAVRVWFAGNVIENNWMGWQTDQQGYGLVIGPRNQANAIVVKGVASDGAGNLTATTGSFGTGASSPVSALCGSPNHCQIKIGGNTYLTQTQTDATHISVSPAPAAGTFTNVSQCTAGLNPNAIGTDYIVEWNDFRNVANGIDIASVASDCGDPSLQNTRGSIQNNLFQGISAQNNSGLGINAIVRCLPVLNTESAVTITNIVRRHNTCIISNGYAFGNSGVDVTYDSTATTTSGSSGSYLANMITTDNIGPAGGVFTYKAGGLYPGGAAAGLKQMSCTPPVTGSTCTYAYAANVLGQNLWTNQLFNAPFPTTNQTCNGSGATCFPSGSAFTSLFTQYNSGSGQPGYLGDYHLAGSTYKLAGTDGLDIGGNITQIETMTSGVWSPTTYTAASITQASPLPGATFAVPYSQCLTATSASDFQYWTVTSGNPSPVGLSLSLAGCLSGTPNATGTITFSVSMMDAAQQYASKSFTLTVSGGSGPSPTANWLQAFTNPAGCADIQGFAIRQSNNEWYLACRDGIFMKSTNQGGAWTNITSNITFGTNGIPWSIQVNPNDGSLVASTGGNPVGFWVSSAASDGGTWTQITASGYHDAGAGADSGCALPLVSGGGLVCGGYFGSTGSSAFYSSNNGSTAQLVSSYVGGSTASVLGLATNPVDRCQYMGTETQGIFKSCNGGATFNNILTTCPGPCSGTYGDNYWLTFDVNGYPVFVGNGGVWKCTGSGFTYSCSNTFHTNQGRGLFTDSLNSIYYGHLNSPTWPNSMYRSLNGGVTFTAWDTGLPMQYSAVWIQENQTDGKIYAVIVNPTAPFAASVYSTPK